jgi:cobalt-zinc-cadmium efflux system outer membrane protein
MKAIPIAVLALALMNPSPNLIGAVSAADAGFSGKQAAGRPVTVSLDQALSRVYDNNPELMISRLEAEAAAARITQAGLKPNPELSLEAENFPSIDGPGFASYLESTILLSQRFEIGGKRGRRIKAAESYKSMADRAIEVRKADITATTASAFFAVLAEQERLSNRRALTRLSQQYRSVVLDRIAAGKVSPVEQTLVEVELASVQMEEERQKKNLSAAKSRLAAMWGGSSRDFDRAAGSFEIPPKPDIPSQNCPDLELAEAAIIFRKSALMYEQAATKSDITLSAGFRHLNIENVSAFVFNVSIPLPVFDRRQGSIAEARILINKAASEKRALERQLKAELAEARHERDIALLEANSLSQKALPGAVEALSAVEEGYRLGKFTFMEVLAAQRTYAELQQRYIEAVASGLEATVEINRLTHCDSGAKPPTYGAATMEGHDER